MKLWILALLLVATSKPPADSGRIDTFAGTGQAGLTGDGGPAKAATLQEPFHCELDGRGGLLVADAPAGLIRRVDLASGRIETVAGRSSTIGTPYAVAIDPDGSLYIVDQKTPVVRKVDATTGRVSVLAGTGEKGSDGDGGPASRARLREPNDCCLDGKGGLLIADVADWRVRRVDLKSGIITTFAGTGKSARKPDRSAIGDGGPAVNATIVGARAVCIDGRGNTYICEREGNAIRKVDPAGTMTTIAGTGAVGYSGDGAAAIRAIFNGPKGLRADAEGNLFVVDTENHAIRKVGAKDGLISTVAGGRKGAGGDGADATAAGLDRPHGCTIAPDGTLYIADSNNHRVRRVSPRAEPPVR